MSRLDITNMTVDEILDHNANETMIYNYNSREPYDVARVICGDSNGIINFEQTNHKWAKQLYKNMQGRDWTPERVNISKDVAGYTKLTPGEKRMYDLVLAQLISNDSIQTQQLMIGISSYITSPAVSAALSRQAYEESVHADSYTILAEQICQDTDRIYRMHEVDINANPNDLPESERAYFLDRVELVKKNKSVADMYMQIYKDTKEVKVIDVIMAFVANQILEELVFPGGFLAMYTLEQQMSGTAQMIMEINDLGLPVEQSAA